MRLFRAGQEVRETARRPLSVIPNLPGQIGVVNAVPPAARPLRFRLPGIEDQK